MTMNKAEERAWEWASKNKLDPYSMGRAYEEGYHQAEKDLALTWTYIRTICQIEYEECKNVALNQNGSISESFFYQHVLKRFLETKSNQ